MKNVHLRQNETFSGNGESVLADTGDAQVITIQSSLADLPEKLQTLPFTPTFVSGYASPHIDLEKVASAIKRSIPSSKLLICSTSGELCNDGQKLYCDTPQVWDNVVLQLMGADIVQAAEVVSIPLACEDLKQGRVDLDMTQRVERIRKNINDAKMSLPVDFRDTLAYILFDGLSASESFFMDALYSADRFPCLFVGGSAGGKLDFQNTWIHDGDRLLQGHASIAFLKLAPHVRFGVFKSQNFDETGT